MGSINEVEDTFVHREKGGISIILLCPWPGDVFGDINGIHVLTFQCSVVSSSKASQAVSSITLGNGCMLLIC